MVELIDESNEDKESWLEKMLALPGAFSLIFFLAMFLPLLGFPSELSWALLTSFSIPTAYAFIMMAVLNRHISFKKHIPILTGLSFLIYILSRAPTTPSLLYAYIIFFVAGTAIASLSYFIYYLLYRFAKRMFGTEEVRIRKRFLIMFIPAMVIMFLLLFLIGGIVIGVVDEEIITVAGWLNGIVGGL